MGIITIRKAKREGARIVLALAGMSGGGKTRTALEVAYGMTDFNAEKIGFLDTENKRGSLYADCLKNEKGDVQEFLIADLEPPFSPARYTQAIKEFEAAKVEVLIIDTGSHEYEGTGGILEMREPLPGKRAFRDAWAKAEHKKFVNALLQSPMHIIICLRAREKMKPEKVDDKTVYVSQGIQPICEKNFMFEMTASILMEAGGKMRTVLKSGDGTEEIFGAPGFHEGFLTRDHGLRLRQWVAGGSKVDAKAEEYRARLNGVTHEGVSKVKECWDKTPATVRKRLGNETLQNLIAAAEEYERLQQDQSDTGELSREILNEE